MTDTTKFSIFDPVIVREHREFYEQIVNELNVILPVCNQGKCLAMEISRNPAEQETIRELMERVERFRGELLVGTKHLFDQFYQSKESFHRMLQSTIAYVKINLIDRNLLERTCDVRWWALETAFCGCIEEFNHVRENLEHLAELVEDYRHELLAEQARLSAERAGFSLWKLLFDRAKNGRRLQFLQRRLELLDGFVEYLKDVGLLLHQERHAAFTSRLQDMSRIPGQTGKERNLVDLAQRLNERVGGLRGMIAYACDRLQTIRSSYTLYRDLVICDSKGNIIATSNAERRPSVIGKNVAGEGWFKQAMLTQSGAEYVAQDLASSAVEEQLSLVYSTAIRHEGRETNPAIGAMGIYFDFQGEAGIILDDYMPGDKDGAIRDGWCSFLTNDAGQVIASSDEAAFPVGACPTIPRAHRKLPPGKTGGSYGIFMGEEGALFTARTDGYLDYKGLGWNSHLVLPRRDIFRRQELQRSGDLDMESLLGSRIIPAINKKTYANVQKDKRALQLISTNGMLFAAELGSRGQALSPVFEQITRTGDFATACMEDLLREMAADALNLNFQTLKLFAKQAIDLIDRNLFERSADIRWWSTDRYFWEALSGPSEDRFREASERLKVINNSYTMYRNLILADASGRIVACSRPAMLSRLREVNVSGHDWFQQGVQTQSATQFVVQDVCQSELEPTKKGSLVYGGGVRAGGAKEGDAVGVLGILFDWDTEAKKMLEKCLPRDNTGEFIEGSAAFYTNAAGEIIETTDDAAFRVGAGAGCLGGICASLAVGGAASGFVEWNGQAYIIGSAKTKGYREYSGLSWTAHVVRPF